MISKLSAPAGRVRDAQKAQTRARVIEAAKAMIVERGFEATTIRDIAQRAGVATGSVFTTFSDKTELLLEVVFGRYGALLSEVRLALEQCGDDPRERLLAAALAAYTMELREERLVAEALAASWLWTPAIEAEHKRRLEPLLQIIRSAVLASTAGQDRSEEETALSCEMIYACYLRNFRRALFEGWRPGELTAELSKQINRILGPAMPNDQQAPKLNKLSLERQLTKV